jgi:hypothetical protein
VALISAQLLFVDRIDDDTVRLDVIVLDRAQTSVSPPVGAGLAFDLQLPAEPDYRHEVVETLTRWAARSATVDLTLLEWRTVTKILVASASESVILTAPTPVA